MFKAFPHVAAGQIVAENGTYSTKLYGRWMLAYGTSTLRVAQQLRAISGNYGAKAKHRTAAVLTSVPSATWTVSATARTANGAFPEDFSLAGIGNVMWIQPAADAAIHTGTTPAEAYHELFATGDFRSAIVGGRAVEFQPAVNTGESDVFYVTRPFPAVGVTGLMFGFQLIGLSGTVSYAPVFRTFDGDDNTPNAWGGDLATYSSITADELRNSGDLAVSPGTKLLMQAGVRIGGTSGRGLLRTVVAAKGVGRPTLDGPPPYWPPPLGAFYPTDWQDVPNDNWEV